MRLIIEGGAIGDFAAKRIERIVLEQEIAHAALRALFHILFDEVLNLTVETRADGSRAAAGLAVEGREADAHAVAHTPVQTDEALADQQRLGAGHGPGPAGRRMHEQVPARSTQRAHTQQNKQ